VIEIDINLDIHPKFLKMSSKASDYAYVNSSKAQGDQDGGQIPQSQLYRRPEATSGGSSPTSVGNTRANSSNTPEPVAKFSLESSALESLDIGELENSMWRKVHIYFSPNRLLYNAFKSLYLY
jgi:hypothetical protein